MADDEIQLVSDGDGLAVFGEPSAVERFVNSVGLPSKELVVEGLSSNAGVAAGATQAAAEIASNYGRWVKLTEESVQKINQHGLMKGSASRVQRGVVQAKDGQIKGIIEFTRGGLTNPALLSGAAGVMAQLAMKQTMDEITDYLATIDKKLDDVLRAQKDAVLADMIGVDLVIDEAMTIRSEVGRVSDVTWSKVQATSATIARTQAYALRQLDAMAGKLERETSVGDLAKASKEAEAHVRDWLAVLARCFQLLDAIAILELDRVLDSSPDELDRHRLGLKSARANRRELIARSTENLITRIDAAARTANAKVLMHPSASKTVVRAGNQVGVAVTGFEELLGIESGRQALDSRRWSEAAVEARDKALETGAEGVDAARRLGTETLSRARSAKGKLSDRIAERRGRDDEG